MNKILKIKKFKNNQSGVTLLLSILVLSSIMAISFSLATILFIEVRNSGDLLRTEGAFYGSQAVTEEALFKIKREVPDSQLSYSAQLGNVALTTSPPSFTDNPIIQIKVPPSSNSFANTRVHYPLFDHDCPNPDPGGDSICQAGGSGYGKIRLTYLSSGNTEPLKIYLCEFDPSYSGTYSPPGPACSNPDVNEAYWKAADFPLTAPDQPGLYHTYTWTLNPNKQQELILFNDSGALAQSNIYVQIETFGPDGTTPKGVPLVGITALDISAQNNGVNRKLRLTVPNNNSISSSVPLGNSASFVKADNTTGGSWHGVYGTDGYNIFGATQSYPAYVTVTPIGIDTYTWEDPTADVRGLYKDAVTTDRIAYTWYSNTTFDLDVNITDSAAHQVAIYMVDWDSFGPRQAQIQVLDGTTSAVLDTQSLPSYVNGTYLVWNLSGHTVLRFNTIAGNVVTEGIFFR